MLKTDLSTGTVQSLCSGKAIPVSLFDPVSHQKSSHSSEGVGSKFSSVFLFLFFQDVFVHETFYCFLIADEKCADFLCLEFRHSGGSLGYFRHQNTHYH